MQATATLPSVDVLSDNDALEADIRVAHIMSGARSTIPVELRGNVGDCLSVIFAARTWRMNPYFVAQHMPAVRGVPFMDGQLTIAVINTSGLIEGKLQFTPVGEWEKLIGRYKMVPSSKGGNVPSADWKKGDEDGLGLIVSATLRGEKEPRVLRLMLVQASERNSTLWHTDPLQQLHYLAARRWSRVHTPEVQLGYSEDEAIAVANERDMGAAVIVEPMGAGDGTPQQDAGTRQEQVKESLRRGRKSSPAANPEPPIQLAEVLRAIDLARASGTPEAFKLAADMGKRLTAKRDRDTANTAYSEAIREAKDKAAQERAASPQRDLADENGQQQDEPEMDNTLTAAEVRGQLNEARDDREALELAGDLIRFVPDEVQRDELTKHYHALSDELGART
ncbi:recombinase RecT [Cupriavidus taiwanensis]|uniref:recombinase RecT n=1 Tax=Cupriavidus taiwanensis TaxID=164546 RepID=UPI000E134DEF|nr:recombinase RecT [Cupriavidus taiwanensis]SPA17213.1 conserved hypothetical protein [Cupriavidus taiwanensis]